MIEIYDAVFPSQEQLKAVALGMRHAMNSEERSDTPGMEVPQRQFGRNDYELARRLVNAGKNNRSHCKFLRQMPVSFTVIAPMYWYKEADTYKIGTVRNSSSTMHKIASKPFSMDDFSIEHLLDEQLVWKEPEGEFIQCYPKARFQCIVNDLNTIRELYLIEENPERKKVLWWQLIQMLPSSYNQTSTFYCNYEVLHKIWIDRHDHKLDEWRQFCQWIQDAVPMSDLIVPKGDL